MAVMQDDNERVLDNRLIAAAVREAMIPFNAMEENIGLGIDVLTSGLLISCSLQIGEFLQNNPICVLSKFVTSIYNEFEGHFMYAKCIISLSSAVAMFRIVLPLINNRPGLYTSH